VRALGRERTKWAQNELRACKDIIDEQPTALDAIAISRRRTIMRNGRQFAGFSICARDLRIFAWSTRIPTCVLLELFIDSWIATMLCAWWLWYGCAPADQQSRNCNHSFQSTCPNKSSVQAIAHCLVMGNSDCICTHPHESDIRLARRRSTHSSNARLSDHSLSRSGLKISKL
jgi:hypothetical protein